MDSIQSVIAQTYENWELLIVDDCSTDNTVELIKSVKDDRIKLFQSEKNSGASVCRNKALREAKGKWIAFLDSDDTWAPEKLQKQIRFMKDNNYSFTYTDYRICYNGNWLPYVYIGPDMVNKRRMYNYCYFSTITVIYDRDVVGLIQIKNLKKHNDYAMWLQIVEKCNAFRFPECLSYYIKHGGSISTDSKMALIKGHYLLFREGLEKSAFLSFILTVNNIIHGVMKKIRYRKRIKSGDGECLQLR